MDNPFATPLKPAGQWYARIRGRVLGPLSLEQLRALRDSGQFRRFHEVSPDQQSWAPATTLGELFPRTEPKTSEVPGKRQAGLETPSAGVPVGPGQAAVPPPLPAKRECQSLDAQGKQHGRERLAALAAFLADPVGALPSHCAS